MKKMFTLSMLALFLFGINTAQAQICSSITVTTNPTVVTDVTQPLTITTTLTCPTMAWTTGDLYVWMWDDASGVYPNGSWTASDPSMMMTNNLDGTYSFTFTPSTLSGVNTQTSIGFLVKALDGTGDNKTPDQSITITPLGINQLSGSSFTISPNPSNGIFSIVSQTKSALEIFDITGKTVFKDALNKGVNTLNISNVHNGIYFAKVSDGKAVEIKKIVIQ